MGPTAVGKSRYAMNLAEAEGYEIVSVDSMQIYRYMNIGTAKPTQKERDRIPHHLIDIVNPNDNYNVSQFYADCTRIIQQLLDQGKKPLLVGGTGLYLRALLQGFSFPVAPPNAEIRNKLTVLNNTHGNGYLHQLLQEKDTKSAERIHPHDIIRLIRALEVIETTGIPLSSHCNLQKPPFVFDALCLSIDRDRLYCDIDLRVEQMVEQGLVKEVADLLTQGYSPALTSMQAIGYKEMINVVLGNCALATAIASIQQTSRHFAKRQLTWFRRFDGVKWIEKGA